MRKLFFLSLGLGLLVSCGESSKSVGPSESSSSQTDEELISSSSSLGGGDNPVNPDTVFQTDHVPVYVEDTTGKELHYVGNSALRITEITPINLDWLDHDGDDPGWVEIYNAGSDTADLRGYSLVENLKNPRKWIIDKLIIPPGGLRTIFCSKKNITAPLEGLDSDAHHFRTHTNWKLEKDSGTVYLIDYNWGIRDSVTYPAIPEGNSWGIVNGGEWKYFAKPTPEKKNTESTAYDGYSESYALPPAGFYNEGLTIPAPNVQGTVRCTFDGSEPNESSQPLTDSKFISQSMIVRCVLYQEGKIPQRATTESYFVGVTHKMPIVSIAVSPEFFQKHYMKVSCNEPKSCPSGLYEDVEYPVHVEYFANGSSSKTKDFEIEAGISMFGNYSRMEDKKSVAITMREQYQDGRLHYPLFETRKETASKFKSFNLRNNGNRFVSDYIEDAMGGAILEGSGVDYQRSRQVVVYYNGTYYGIHDMRDRYNRHFVENHYGIDADNVEVIKHLGHSITASGDGSTAGYEELLNFVYANNFSGENNTAYQTASTMMDMGNFADYMIAEMYSHNGDWPNNNVRAWRSTNTPWKFMVYDLDHGFDWMWNVEGFGQSTNMYNWVAKGGLSSSGCSQNQSNYSKCFNMLYNKLIENPDFKRLFINHAAVMLDNYLNGKRVSAVVDAMAASIDDDEVERDVAKFNRSDRFYKNSCGSGFSKSGSCMKTWAMERDSKFRSETVSNFGLGKDISVSIVAEGNGIVTLDGMTLPSKSYSGKFFEGNPMLLTAIASGSSVFSGWEDGSRENPRLIIPGDGKTYKATFR